MKFRITLLGDGYYLTQVDPPEVSPSSGLTTHEIAEVMRMRRESAEDDATEWLCKNSPVLELVTEPSGAFSVTAVTEDEE